MSDCGARVFFYLYPSKRKEIPEGNDDGEYLRVMLLIAIILHSGLAFFCLAFVGFWPMLINVIQAAFAYSCYLTMREREVVFYLFLLIVQVVTQFLGLFEPKTENDQGSLKFLGAMICICVCAVLGYLVGKAYYSFRVVGGLHMLYKPILEAQKAELEKKLLE